MIFRRARRQRAPVRVVAELTTKHPHNIYSMYAVPAPPPTRIFNKVRFLTMRTACAQIRAFHAHHTSRATNFNSKLEIARLRFAFLKIGLYFVDHFLIFEKRCLIPSRVLAAFANF
eukprot:sb/3476640/